MTPTETADILRQFNEWRRGDEDIPQFDPCQIGEAIDAAVEMIERLEAAESSVVWHRRRWMALQMHQMKMREPERTMVCYRKARDERDELRARIEAMEKQGPVAWSATDETGTVVEALGMNRSRRFDTALYLAPGAQPAPSISPVALRHVIQWLRNGCDPMKAADELEMLAAAPEATP